MKRKYEEHFDFSSDGSAQCKICGNKYKSGVSSNCGLKYHLKSKHGIEEDSKQSEEAQKKRPKQQTISNFVVKKPVEEVISIEAAMYGASYRYLTLSPVIKKGLEGFGYIQPRSVTTIANMVHKHGEEKRGLLKAELQRLAKDDHRFGLILDEWTCGLKRKRYLSICLHEKGTNYNLGLVPIEGSLCANELKQKLEEKVQQFGLDFTRNINGIASDGCSLMKRLGKDCNILHQLCVAHSVHLAVTKTMYQPKKPQPESDMLLLDAIDQEEEETKDEENFEELTEEELQVFCDENSSEDELEEVEVPLKETYEAVIKKVRTAVNKINRSPVKSSILQDAVKAEQKKAGETEKPMMLKCNVKTRWNSLIEMISSVLRIEKVFLAVAADLTGLKFSDAEMKILKEVQGTLEPLKTLVEKLCSEKADLVTADIGFQCLFQFLQQKQGNLAQELLNSLKEHYKERRNDNIVGLMKYLEKPDAMKKKEKDAMFKLPSRHVLEKTAKECMVRLFNHDDNDDENDSSQSDEDTSADGEVDFASFLNKAIQDAEEEKVPKKRLDYKSIGSEMTAFEKIGIKTENLEKLYKALANLPPTSVSCERIFSISGDFVTKKRSRLSDKSMDDLVFLKGCFLRV